MNSSQLWAGPITLKNFFGTHKKWDFDGKFVNPLPWPLRPAAPNSHQSLWCWLLSKPEPLTPVQEVWKAPELLELCLEAPDLQELSGEPPKMRCAENRDDWNWLASGDWVDEASLANELPTPKRWLYRGADFLYISQIQTKNLAWMVVLLGASVLSGSLEVIMKIHM